MKTKQKLLEEALKSLNLTPQSVLRFANPEGKSKNVVVYQFTEEQLDLVVNDNAEINTPESRL